MKKPKLFIKDNMLIYEHSKTKSLDITVNDCLECGTALGMLRVRVDENTNPTNF